MSSKVQSDEHGGKVASEGKNSLKADSETVLSDAQVLRLVAGFSRVTWGIPIMLLLFAKWLRIPIIPIPSYVIGLILVFWGTAILLSARPINPRMDRKIEMAVLLSLLQLYFVPFLYWWSDHQGSLFFSVNILLLGIVTGVMLILLNQLAAEFAELCHDEFFKVESMLCAWMALGLFATLLVLLLVYVGIHFFRADGFQLPRLRLYPWILAVLVMPFTLTLASMWKCRRKCVELLD